MASSRLNISYRHNYLISTLKQTKTNQQQKIKQQSIFCHGKNEHQHSDSKQSMRTYLIEECLLIHL